MVKRPNDEVLGLIKEAVGVLPASVLDFSKPVIDGTEEEDAFLPSILNDALRTSVATSLRSHGMDVEGMSKFCKAIKGGMEPVEALELVGIE